MAVAHDMEGADAGVIKEFAADRLDTWQTFKLSGEFCLMWFIANYFSGASFQFTSVASGSILSSTSSIFTLLLAAALGVERFTFAKLLTVLLSLFGIGLISSTDLDSGPDEEYPRTPKEYMIGDAMALLGALAYAIYTTVMKVRVGSEDRVDMQQFFGFVGVINAVCLWPGLLFLDWMKWETFEAPPDERVWLIVISNAVITLVSDFAWAHAMLYTTPLLVTVGLSLTIPLSLLGQVIFFDKDLTFTYAIGAAMVFIAFWGINKEEEPDIVAMEASRRASLIGPSIVASQPEDDLDIIVPGASGSE
ncbi:hypothetical protein HDU85_001544 [Gaertneriomyces sp. JEL0708]|nr:hypothetical protein HDU85_001544 [Gaertneriomyces sp. JEL0708]